MAADNRPTLTLQIRQQEGFIYNSYENSNGGGSKDQQWVEKLKEDRKLAYSGKLSDGASKRMTKAITLLVEISKKRKIYNEISKRVVYHRLSFITLTIHSPERNITANEAYKTCLKPLLRWITRTKGTKLYVWKAEKQKRGQIHYHIITPSWINQFELKEKWNNLQSEAGYLDQYYSQHGHINAPSIHINSVRKVKDIAAYLISYFKKVKNDKDGTRGKVWDCSYNLKNGKYFATPPDSTTADNITKGIKSGEIITIHLDNCTILKFIKKPAKYYLSKTQYKQYLTHLQLIANQPTEAPPPERIHTRHKIKIQNQLNY